jgi:hypothetical protein
MYCPNCASPADEGQRYCRKCGINLGLIVDAMEGKRQPLDFEALKEDLRQLGSNLRAGFEEAKQELRKTQQLGRKQRHHRRHGYQRVPETAEVSTDAATSAMNSALAPPPPPVIKVKTGKQPHSRRYSLQQAMLSIFGGASGSAALYYLLGTAAHSGLLTSVEQILVNEVFKRPDLVGLAPVLGMLWVLGLMPVAKGFAHLINGIFFAPRAGEGEQTFVLNQSFSTAGSTAGGTAGGERTLQSPSPEVATDFAAARPEPVGAKTTPTNEFEDQWRANFRPSVTEEETVRLGARERQAE